MHEHIGRIVKEVRSSKKIRLRNLADSIGISNGEMSKIENGKKYLSDERLDKISKTLKVDIYKIFMEHPYKES